MKCSINYREHEVGISANDFLNFVGSCGKAMFSFMSVRNSVYRGGFHVTSTHDALDLIIQDPSSLTPPTVRYPASPLQGPDPTPSSEIWQQDWRPVHTQDPPVQPVFTSNDY